MAALPSCTIFLFSLKVAVVLLLIFIVCPNFRFGPHSAVRTAPASGEVACVVSRKASRTAVLRFRRPCCDGPGGGAHVTQDPLRVLG